MNNIEGYKRYLGFQHCMTNSNGQIWYFWKGLDHTICIANIDQQLTLNMKDTSNEIDTFVTAVYAKCTPVEREDLWESIGNIHNQIKGPWCMKGDFNVIMDPDEKLSGLPHRMSKSMEFINCMEACGLSDIGFTGKRGLEQGLCRIYQMAQYAGFHAETENKDSMAQRWKHFNLNLTEGNNNILECIPQIIIAHDNTLLTKMPDEEEIKQVVFSMSKDSSPGPDRLNPLLRGLISENQSGFVSGRSITDNVMLTQEIVHGISNLNNEGNVILKLDMAKAYDRKWTSVTQLAYADEIVIFSSENTKSIKLIMKQIRNYECVFGRQVNMDKSFFLTDPKTCAYRINRIRAKTGLLDKSFPFNYLGCPIYIDRKKISYFDSMSTKVIKRLNVWQGNMLSCGGRQVFIKSVINSLLIYILSAINPPKGTLKLIQNHIVSFFWGTCNGKTSTIGLLGKSSIVQRMKLELAKYCSRVHPVGKKWCSGNSQAWKYLLWARDKCEKQITWKINAGKYSFWWDAQKLYNTLPSQIALHIMSIELGQDNKNDYAIWNATEDGHFTNGSAWNMIREHREINVTINKIWHKSIPFKQSFMCWRIFFGRIPIRNSITRLDSQDTEVCRCCPTPARETLQHVFVDGRAAEYKQCTQSGIARMLFPKIDTNGTWSNLCTLMEKLKPAVVCTPVRWIKPALGWIKINSDGSFIRTSRKAGIGGIARDNSGDFVFAFSIPIQANSSSQAEATTVRFGIEWCTQQGYSNIHVETDSLMSLTFLIKEANQVVDLLAKLASTSGNKTLYHSQDNLPREAKGLIQLDKWQFPSFRRRYEKYNFFVS
ncbi:uncharacterized protein LOC142169044 [Nicotiana tabacum]|uniref:Uncharacterized protein LOC142169044 n=1 Tax=Nicotiana tabacum TaxID=4097 RepID=A0AC58SMZ0_TOBAC